MSSPASRFPGLARRAATLTAIAALGAGAGALTGCDLPGSGDDDDTVATTPTTPDTEPAGPTGPSRQNGGDGGGGRGGGGAGADLTPEDTGPTVPESGGVGADDYDPEQDVEGNDIPPPEGSPQADFEQFCAQNPAACD